MSLFEGVSRTVCTWEERDLVVCTSLFSEGLLAL